MKTTICTCTFIGCALVAAWGMKHGILSPETATNTQAVCVVAGALGMAITAIYHDHKP